MQYQNLLVEKENNLISITINRPEKLNALNRRTIEELDFVFTDIESDEVIKGVLLTGSGDKAFVAGADISEIQALDLRSGKSFAQFGQSVFSRIENCSKPVLALVNGFALGGGCELAMACHLRIASETAKFGQPEVNLGLIPGYGGTQRMFRLIGKGRALELLLTGNMIDARRAYETGLVNQVVEPEALREAGMKLMQTILTKAPLATAYVLETVNRGLDLNLDQGLAVEADYFGKSCASDDMKEGTTAFLEKRKAIFRGK